MKIVVKAGRSVAVFKSEKYLCKYSFKKHKWHKKNWNVFLYVLVNAKIGTFSLEIKPEIGSMEFIDTNGKSLYKEWYEQNNLSGEIIDRIFNTVYLHWSNKILNLIGENGGKWSDGFDKKIKNLISECGSDVSYCSWYFAFQKDPMGASAGRFRKW